MKNKKGCLSVFWINVAFIILFLLIGLYVIFKDNNPFN